MTVETDAIIAYHDQSGAPGLVRDINTPGVHSSGSYHYRFATWAPAWWTAPWGHDCSKGNQGCAVDFGFNPGQWDSPGLLDIFEHFEPVEHLLAELIHSHAPYRILNGQRLSVASLPQSVIDAHHNHVHVAVRPGVRLPMPSGVSTMPSQIAACLAPEGGSWRLTDDGGVRALGGAPFYGSYPGLPPAARQGSRRFIGIQARGPRNTDGYVLFGNDDSLYAFGPGLNGF